MKIFIHRRMGELVQNIPNEFMSKSHVGLTVIVYVLETTNIHMADYIVALWLRS